MKIGFINSNRAITIKNNNIHVNFTSLRGNNKDTVSFKARIRNKAILPFNYSETNPDFDRSSVNPQINKLINIASEGIPVVRGFVLSNKDISKDHIPEDLKKVIHRCVEDLGNREMNGFGSTMDSNPLILSVGYGNNNTYVGFNSGTAKYLIDTMGKTEDKAKSVYDSYANAISTFGTSVFGVNPEKFSDAYSTIARRNNINHPNEMTSGMLKNQVIPKFKEVIKQETGRDFPEDVNEQLEMAIKAKSDDESTAIQSKTITDFKNNGMGVCFSRDPETGENKVSGSFIMGSTGSQLMQGMTRLKGVDELVNHASDDMEKLSKYAKQIEKMEHKPQSVKFVIRRRFIEVLSADKLNQTGKAAIKTAVDMNKEGLINDSEALALVKPEALEDSLSTRFKPEAADKAKSEGRLLTAGEGASSSADYGKAVFDVSKAKELIKNGENVVLIKKDTNAEDVEVMINDHTKGIIAANAGPTGHAAVIARGMDKPCVVSCDDFKIDEQNNKAVAGNKTVNEGDLIAIDGKTGNIFEGKVDKTSSKPDPEFFEILRIADKEAKVDVLANADTPEDVELSKQRGAKGVGLCRTEHMFFGEDRTPVMQRVILADSDKEREDGLKQLEKMQYNDFRKMLGTMKQKGITIRLLDPPLNEFLPKSRDLRTEIAKLEVNSGQSRNSANELKQKKELLEKVEQLEESNPMLGRRGSRLGIVIPEIYKMQVRAIVNAAMDTNSKPKIMLPMISDAREFKVLKDYLQDVAKEVVTDRLGSVNPEAKRYLKGIKFGTMIETPRAALIADELAEDADFLSLGTNDLTQMTYGISRDDAQKGFINDYMEKGIFKSNPFIKIDKKGVGRLIQNTVEDGRKTKPNLEIGVCGEQGADPDSMKFFQNAGIDYVSTSPSGIYKARLSAGKEGSKKTSFSGRQDNSSRDKKSNFLTQSIFNGLTGKTNEPDKSDSLNSLKTTLDREFQKSLSSISKEGQLTAQEVKYELSREYGNQTANAVDVSGDNVGFNNLVLLIPGIYEDGKVPDIFPVIDPEPYRGYMGGGHWYTEGYLANQLLPEVRKNNPDFSFQKLRQDLGMKDIGESKGLPLGVNFPTKAAGVAIDLSNTDAFHDGKPNYASIHGFIIYDRQDNNYIVLDNKNGIRDFVLKNSDLFDNLKQRFSLKGIVVGGSVVNLDEEKERRDKINQVRGQLYTSGVSSTDFGSKPDQLSTADLIEVLTNPASNKKYINSLQKERNR